MFDGDIWNATEVAHFLGVSTRTVRRWSAAGFLPRYRLMGQWRYRRREIEAWLASIQGDESWAPNDPTDQSVSAAS